MGEERSFLLVIIILREGQFLFKKKCCCIKVKLTQKSPSPSHYAFVGCPTKIAFDVYDVDLFFEKSIEHEATEKLKPDNTP